MEFIIKVHRIVKRHYKSMHYIKKHQHPFFHYIFVFNGNGYIVVGTKRYEALKGKLFAIPMYTPHAIYSIKDLINFEIKFTCNEELSLRLNSLSSHEFNLDVFEEKILRDIVSEGIFHLDYFEQVIDLKLGELIVMLLRKKHKGAINKDQYLVWETNRMIWTGLLHKHMHEIVQMIHAEPEKTTGMPPKIYREKSQGDMVFNVIPDSSLIPLTQFEHDLIPITDLNILKYEHFS